MILNKGQAEYIIRVFKECTTETTFSLQRIEDILIGISRGNPYFTLKDNKTPEYVMPTTSVVNLINPSILPVGTEIAYWFDDKILVEAVILGNTPNGDYYFVKTTYDNRTYQIPKEIIWLTRSPIYE